MVPIARSHRPSKRADRMTAAMPINRTANSAALHRPSPIADTSSIAQPTRKASITTGAARNATGIRRVEAICRSSSRRAPTGARDPSRPPARHGAAARSSCPARSAVFGSEDVFPNPQRRPDPVLDPVGCLRADERFPAGVDDNHDVPGPLPFVLVREETVESGRGFPVDSAHLVARGILADAPEFRSRADLPRGDLSEPRSCAARLELRSPEVFHRGRDDETGVDREDRILGAEGERIERPHPHRSDPEIAFHERPDGVRQGNRVAAFQGHDRVVRTADDHEFTRQDVHDLDEVQGRSIVPDDELHLDVPPDLRSLAGERPDGAETRLCRRKERTEGEDHDWRQGEKEDLPTPKRQTRDEEYEGRGREAARERGAHVTTPWAREPAPGRRRGPTRSGRLESMDPASG